jgi:predicted DNA-binding transcriptional regulator AlpA
MISVLHKNTSEQWRLVSFPMRVKITANTVGWIQAEVQSWLARRVEASTRLPIR